MTVKWTRSGDSAWVAYMGRETLVVRAHRGRFEFEVKRWNQRGPILAQAGRAKLRTTAVVADPDLGQIVEVVVVGETHAQGHARKLAIAKLLAITAAKALQPRSK